MSSYVCVSSPTPQTENPSGTERRGRGERVVPEGSSSVHHQAVHQAVHQAFSTSTEDLNHYRVAIFWPFSPPPPSFFFLLFRSNGWHFGGSIDNQRPPDGPYPEMLIGKKNRGVDFSLFCGRNFRLPLLLLLVPRRHLGRRVERWMMA